MYSITWLPENCGLNFLFKLTTNQRHNSMASNGESVCHVYVMTSSSHIALSLQEQMSTSEMRTTTNLSTWRCLEGTWAPRRPCWPTALIFGLATSADSRPLILPVTCTMVRNMSSRLLLDKAGTGGWNSPTLTQNWPHFLRAFATAAAFLRTNEMLNQAWITLKMFSYGWLLWQRNRFCFSYVSLPTEILYDSKLTCLISKAVFLYMNTNPGLATGRQLLSLRFEVTSLC